MENQQILYFFGITMLGNVIANTFTQNNIFYLGILFIFLVASFAVGVIVESKYSITKKVNNFNLQKINQVLSEVPNQKPVTFGNDSDESEHEN